MNIRESEYYEQCEHPYSKDIRHTSCLKRHYKVMDFRADKTYNLFVCNDYIKIKMNEEIVKSEYGILLRQESVYNNLVEGIIKDKTKLKTGLWGLMIKGHKLNPLIVLEVCEKPTIYTSYTFYEVLLMISNTKDYAIYHYLIKKAESAFHKVVTYMSHYVKYKNDLRKLKRLQKKFRHIIYKDTESNDMIIQIIDLITKYNIK